MDQGAAPQRGKVDFNSLKYGNYSCFMRPADFYPCLAAFTNLGLRFFHNLNHLAIAAHSLSSGLPPLPLSTLLSIFPFGKDIINDDGD